MIAMSQNDTSNQLLELAAKRFAVAAGTLGADDDFYQALGINSIEALELLSEIELAFDVELPDYELQEVKTFNQLADKINERLT